jgi:hypothetical protein
MSVEKPHPLLTIPSDTRLLGEILTWSCSGLRIQHTDLIEALREAGLDEGVARELAPRHAFSRACKRLSQQRIIRQIGEDARSIRFQFTQEQREGDHFTYALETVLSLDKVTGKVRCDLPGLATLAQEHLDECIAVRTGSDLTRVIQRLFERQADLFPIREKGGCYFSPVEHTAFVDRIDRLLQTLRGNLRRFPVPAGTPQGDRSVREAVAAGLATLIAEHEAAVESFGSDTRPDTIERAARRIQQTRFKLEAYACYLAEERSRLERDLARTQTRLRERIEELAAVV